VSEPLIRLPVVCPQCGDELLTEFPVALLAESLIEKNEVQLHASCHQVSWTASPSEREQIREYLASVVIDSPRGDRLSR
jgi:hypothetical protein